MHKSKKNNVLRVDTEQKPNLLHKNSYRNVYGKNITYITDITHFVRRIGLGVPIVSESTQMIYVKKGSMEVSTGNTIYTLAEHTVMINPEGMALSGVSLSPDLEVHALGFSVEQIMPLSFAQYSPVCIELDAEEAQVLAIYGKMFEALRKCGGARCRASMESLVVSLLQFVGSVGRPVQPQTPVPHTHKGGSIVAAFTTLLRQYGNRKRTVDFYVKRLGLTKNYFCMVIKRETGQTVQSHCNERLLQVSKKMLSGSDFSAKSIAKSLGFSTAAHFGAFFKKETGQTPGEFRRELRAKS